MKTYAIILAAGKGTRMKTSLPKCAYPLLKKPMIEYILDSLDESNIQSKIAVIGHQREVFEDLIGSRVEFCIQEEQLGTGHAVMCCHDVCKDGRSLILCGDTPLVDSKIISTLIKSHEENNNDFTIGTIILDNPYGYGRIVRDDLGEVLCITEEKDASDSVKKIKEINTGLFLINNDILFEALSKVDNNNAKNEYYLTDIVKILAKKVKIGTVTIEDEYKLMGINDLYTLSLVEKRLRKEINKAHMLNGVNIVNEDSVLISKDVCIKEGTIIYPNTIITGNTHIGKNCIIGPNTELHNATLLDDCKCVHSVVYDSKILKSATVGPFAHLRMNSTIGENDRIGNFVEVKNSTLGTKTNIAHLTYVGDTDCGSHVNFGCGTVTVNYDGLKKYRTTIGDNVFIGCNTNLIAPINVESNSYIAAGSTITNDVAEDSLAIARARQVNKLNYVKEWKNKRRDNNGK